MICGAPSSQALCLFVDVSRPVFLPLLYNKYLATSIREGIRSSSNTEDSIVQLWRMM